MNLLYERINILPASRVTNRSFSKLPTNVTQDAKRLVDGYLLVHLNRYIITPWDFSFDTID